MTDPIADMLTRIRNAVAAGREQVSFPYSRIKAAIAQILQANGYVASVEVDDGKPFKYITVVLNQNGQTSPITRLDRISKPGRRIYTPSREIPRVLSGRGMVIVSTSNGLMTGHEARKLGLGGELICKVY